MDRRLAELHDRARRRGGLLTARDFTELDYSRNQGGRMVQRGELTKLQPRVFAFTSVPESRELHIRAAVLAAGPQAALSHVTAAEVLELRHLPTGLAEDRIDISVPRGHKPTVRGVIVHHPLLLPHDHVVEDEHLRYTTLPRTLLDLANVLRGRERAYRRIVDAALSEERTTCEELTEMIAHLVTFPGVRLARTTIETFDPRMIGSRSDLERTFFRGLQAAGVDLPTANVEIRDADGRQRFLDFAYIPERQPIEIDSYRFHASTLARAEDGARQNAIILTGEWRAPLRFDERDVRERMPRVADEVRRTLERIRASM